MPRLHDQVNAATGAITATLTGTVSTLGALISALLAEPTISAAIPAVQRLQLQSLVSSVRRIAAPPHSDAVLCRRPAALYRTVLTVRYRTDSTPSFEWTP